MVLALAFGAGVLVLGAFDDGTDHPITRLVRPANVSTEPTVLDEAIERPTTLPDAPPASPATFTPARTDDVAGAAAPGTTLQGGSPSPTLGPTVSITSPDPPRTTTSTRPTTSTTLGTTTTIEAPTTTSEEPITTTTEAPPIDV